jgi:hypothetical protein
MKIRIVWAFYLMEHLSALPCVPQPLLRAERTWMHDIRMGVRRAVVDAYSDRMYWWEASLMVQRLVRGFASGCTIRMLPGRICDMNLSIILITHMLLPAGAWCRVYFRQWAAGCAGPCASIPVFCTRHGAQHVRPDAKSRGKGRKAATVKRGPPCAKLIRALTANCPLVCR